MMRLALVHRCGCDTAVAITGGVAVAASIGIVVAGGAWWLAAPVCLLIWQSGLMATRWMWIRRMRRIRRSGVEWFQPSDDHAAGDGVVSAVVQTFGSRFPILPQDRLVEDLHLTPRQIWSGLRRAGYLCVGPEIENWSILRDPPDIVTGSPTVADLINWLQRYRATCEAGRT